MNWSRAYQFGGLNCTAIRIAVCSGELRAKRAGAQLVISSQDLARWLEAQR